MTIRRANWFLGSLSSFWYLLLIPCDLKSSRVIQTKNLLFFFNAIILYFWFFSIRIKKKKSGLVSVMILYILFHMIKFTRFPFYSFGFWFVLFLKFLFMPIIWFNHQYHELKKEKKRMDTYGKTNFTVFSIYFNQWSQHRRKSGQNQLKSKRRKIQ